MKVVVFLWGDDEQILSMVNTKCKGGWGVGACVRSFMMFSTIFTTSPCALVYNNYSEIATTSC